MVLILVVISFEAATSELVRVLRDWSGCCRSVLAVTLRERTLDVGGDHLDLVRGIRRGGRQRGLQLRERSRKDRSRPYRRRPRSSVRSHVDGASDLTWLDASEDAVISVLWASRAPAT